MEKYNINIFYSEDDEGYIADIPDLKTCSAFGESPLEALEELMKAAEAWIAEAKNSNKPIPSPKYKPFMHQTS